MPRVFGEQPKPRLLVVGDVDDAELRLRFEALAPTVRFVTRYECETAVNHREWDAAVLWDCDVEISSDACVLQFGGEQTGRLHKQNSTFNGYTRSEEPASNYTLPPQPVGDVSHLVEPLATELVKAGTARVMTVGLHGARDVIDPFLLNSNGRPVAGIFRRRANGWPEWWWLPPDSPDPERWIAAALARWRRLKPDAFEPDVTDWKSDSRWQTSEELGLSGTLAELDEAHAAAVARYETERTRIAAELREASEAADAGPRQLLTSQGDDLKEEVAAALSDLGFEAADADREHAEKGDLLEDLRVSDPGEQGWVALAEVRGYTGGAKLSDLMRIGRFVTRYTTAEGKPPSAAWYVVNQFIGSDPGSRQAPLASNPEEVTVFAESDGLVVHTTDLFSLREKVRSGDLSAEEARRKFKFAGRLSTAQD